MGQIMQRVMKRVGISEKTMKYFFQSDNDRMVSAITTGDLEKVRSIFITAKFDFGEFTPFGENYLHVAIRYDKQAIVEFMIKNEQFPLIDSKNVFGDTPLMIAVMNKHHNLIRYLIEQTNANINAREKYGSSIFMAACSSGSIEIVKMLLDIKQLNVFTRNNSGQNALHRACHFGEIGVVKYLIDNSKLSTLNKDKYGNNCFHIAAKRINMSVIRLMLKKFRQPLLILEISNGEGKDVIMILLGIFNQIKDSDQNAVYEQDVIAYIEDKNNPPNIFQWVERHKDVLRNQPERRKSKPFKSMASVMMPSNFVSNSNSPQNFAKRFSNTKKIQEIKYDLFNKPLIAQE